MNQNDIMKLAKEYYQSFNLEGAVTNNIKFYESFFNVDGAVWSVKVQLPESSFEGHDYEEIVVSDSEKKVLFIINSSGFNSYPHLERDYDDEWDEFLKEE